jgi:tRNA (mo5U34)-methyltransferase
MTPEYLPFLAETARIETILSEHRKRQKWVNQDKKGFLRYRIPFQDLRQFRASQVNCSGETVVIGGHGEVTEHQRIRIKDCLKAFMPWRKGPFSVFGIEIDAEWRSDRKWQRVLPRLPGLEGKVIADIGCNNGYYMFRMAAHKPKFVLGFEPSVQHYYSFKALNSMAHRDELDVDLLGVEHLQLFESCFDVIFLMGIIYHRPSPVDTLRDTLTALKPGGTLILESQAIPGDEPVALFPEKTYAKVPGTYFVPTGRCLVNWLKKSGFSGIEFFCSHPMLPAEQRKTEWMVFESLQDYLHPEDSSLTVEGYPAPLRVYIKAVKK